MMGGVAIELLILRFCALCAAPLGPGDGRRLCGGCRESAERVLRPAEDPKFAAEMRRHYGLEEAGS
jgi:hypothetical protein